MADGEVMLEDEEYTKIYSNSSKGIRIVTVARSATKVL